MDDNEGSFFGGLVLGALLGIIGLIISAAINKRKTTLGALTGFLGTIVVAVVVGLIVFISLANAAGDYYGMLNGL